MDIAWLESMKLSSVTGNSIWPRLSYKDWRETCHTLHRWLQIVGKIRLTKAAWMNHSWHSTLYLTSTGLTTSPIPDGNRTFSIDFDFVRHELYLATSDGAFRRMGLQNESVASFYKRLGDMLTALRIHTHFTPWPSELGDRTRFGEDGIHCTYHADYAFRFWQALVQSDRVFKMFRSPFIGKCSPVHFFWGSLDLAVTRFSGRRAPLHPGGIPNLPDHIVQEAYSHEVSSCGFWPGNDMVPYPAFYSYTYPQPPGFENARIAPGSAFYHQKLREYILPYEDVRLAKNPDNMLLSFLNSTYQAAADLGKWDRANVETDYVFDIFGSKQKAA